jgi:flagellar motility protein MotE (MotC chaperone)
MAKKDNATVNPNPPDILDSPVPKKEKKRSKDKRKKKKKFSIVPILVLLIVIGAITAILGFNVLNIREQYIMPLLRQAPLVGQWFPAPPEEEEAAGPYAGLTEEELISRLTASAYEIENLRDNIQAARDQKALDNATISNLREFEAQIGEYRRLKEALDNIIADGDPQAYAAYFEDISPENAAVIYERIQQSLQNTKEIKDIANTYAEMDPSAAAEQLTDMMAGQADSVVLIMSNIDPRKRARIMGEMEPDDGAALGLLMLPEPTLVPTPTPIVLPDLATAFNAEPPADETPAPPPNVITIP